jgi:hypothetical protein
LSQIQKNVNPLVRLPMVSSTAPPKNHYWDRAPLVLQLKVRDMEKRLRTDRRRLVLVRLNCKSISAISLAVPGTVAEDAEIEFDKML